MAKSGCKVLAGGTKIEVADSSWSPIGLWETEADLKGRILATYQDRVAERGPVWEVYEVSVYGRLASEMGKATHAKANARQIQPGKIDELIPIYQDSTARSEVNKVRSAGFCRQTVGSAKASRSAFGRRETI